MKNFYLFVSTTAFVIAVMTGCILAGCSSQSVGTIPPVYASGITSTPAKKTMRPFRSDQELANYFQELAEKQKSERRRN